MSHQDGAKFAVAAFQRPELANAAYDLAGPESLTGPEVAERMSAALGRTITFRSMPPSEFGAILDAAFGPGAGASATAFYEAAMENPALVSTSVDLTVALRDLPITPLGLTEWAGGMKSVFTA